MVEIRNEQKTVRIQKKKLQRLIMHVLKAERAKRRDVTIWITTDRNMKTYHWQYFKKPRATDVISFGLPGSQVGTEKNYLGDVIVSADTAKRVARSYKTTPSRECERYAVHGVLHLLGYRDDSVRAYRKMFKRQERYVNGRGKR